MRKRFSYWAAPAAAAVAASAVVAVRGQDPAAAQRFLPSQGAPAGQNVRQAGGPAPAAPGSMGIQPPKYNGPPSVVGGGAGLSNLEKVQANTPRIRYTQPVIAGPEGIRPVQAIEQVPTPVPQLNYPPEGGRLPQAEVAPAPQAEAPVPPPMISFDPPSQESVLSRPSIAPAPAQPAPAAPKVEPVVPMAETPAPVTSTSLSPANPAATVLPPAAPPAITPTPAMLPAQVAGPVAFAGNALPSKQTPSVEVMVVAPEAVGVGMPLTYELVVRNVGSVPVTNVRVEDELPARGTLIATDPPAEAAGDRLAWTVGGLDAGAERRVKVTVKMMEEGEIRSRATVAFASTVDARVRVTRPRIAVAVSSPEVARVGEKVPFQLRITNSGSGPASRIVLQARFTDGLIHPHGALIEAELANLPAGQTKTITLEAVAAKAGGQSCAITAAADGNPPESARTGVNLIEPQLVMRQTGPAHCLVKGEPTYTIELANPGTAPTDPITVVSQVPDGFEFVQASDGGSFTPNTKAAGWRLPGLPAGQTRSLTMKLRATGPADGVIRTAAQAAGQGTDPTLNGGVGVISAGMRTNPAPRPLEAKAETAVKAEGVPALRFDVTSAEGVVEVGKEAVYEIRVVNQGTGPCTGVQVVADLSDGTTAAGASGPSTARGSGQQVVFDPLPQLGVRQEVAYRVRVRGGQPGDMRFRVRLTCNEIRTPTVKEENTRFFKE